MDANPPVNQAPPPPTENDVLEAFFTYHAPTDADKVKYNAINEAALNLAKVVLAQCPQGPDRSAAIRQVREARMTANAAIACRGAKLPY